MNRSRSIAALTAVALLSLLLVLPAGASAATYHSKRPGFEITLQTRGKYIREVQIVFTARCDGQRQADSTYFGRDKRIRGDGRFRYESRIGTSLRQVLVGRVGSRRITGRFRSRVSVSTESCHTGTRSDPFIHF